MKHILHTCLHKTLIAAFLIFLWCGTSANAQNNGLSIYVSTELADIGDTVELTVSVTGFVNIARYKFNLSWYNNYFQYIEHTSNGSLLMNQFTIWLAQNILGRPK
jgi:hypothetical protein